MENIALTGSADAAQVLNAFGGASPMGFLQIMFAVVILALIAGFFVIYRDRRKVKRIRDGWQESHEKRHESDMSMINMKIELLEKNMASMQTIVLDRLNEHLIRQEKINDKQDVINEKLTQLAQNLGISIAEIKATLKDRQIGKGGKLC
jgi:type III secretory pathway component EscV